MNILITGGNTINKGAHLMLIAVANQLKKKYPKINLFLGADIELTQQLNELGYSNLKYPFLLFNSTIRSFRLMLHYPKLTKFILKYRYGKDYPSQGSLFVKDMDVIVDVSGFAFGDKWGNRALLNLLDFSKYCSDRNMPLILMPQAFGPFSGGLKELATKAFKDIDLILARDKTSFSCISNVNIKDNVYLYPDITLVHHPVNNTNQNDENYACLVPNERMLDKASESWKTAYFDYIEKTINLILEKSQLNIVVLAHCTKSSQDYKIVQTITNKFSSNFRVQMQHDENPLNLKTIIANAEFLIGSRFHAIASGLSSNVPCVATSWNHKYEELLMDYDSKTYSHSEANSEFLESIQSLLDEKTRQEYRARLERVNQNMKDKNIKMWDEIDYIIKPLYQ